MNKTSGTIDYNSAAGSLRMVIVEHKDLIKAFKTIVLMEQSRIDSIKAEEKSLKKAQELIEQEIKKKSD